MNSISRERQGRLVRDTKCFSKKRGKLTDSYELFHFYWNFMDKLTKTETPAMLEGLADHQWNCEQFFYFSLRILNQDTAELVNIKIIACMKELFL